jgi:hypothetical protein
MGKTFAHATLLSATVMAAFMIMIPINHLSAQNEVKIDEKLKVRKATIENLPKDGSGFMASLEQGIDIPVVLNASTTVFLGNGDQADLSFLKEGIDVYVFGEYDPSAKDIPATKVVIRNKRITERTTLSRAQQEAEDNKSKLAGSLQNPLEVFGLSAR